MQIPQNPLSFLWFFARKHIVAFGLLFFASAIWATNNALFPYFIKLTINAVQDLSGSFQHILATLKYPLSWMIGFLLVVEIALRVQGYISLLILPIFKADIREAVYKYVQKHSHQFFINNFSGNISYKISDLPRCCETLINIVCFSLIPVLIIGFLTFYLMWSLSPIFFFTLFFWCVSQFVISACFNKIFNNAANKHSESLAELNGKIVDSLSNIFTVRLFSRSAYENAYINKFQKIEIDNGRNLIWKIEKSKIIQGLSSLLLVISMLLLLIYGWAAKSITIGDFYLVITLTFTMIGFMWNINFQLTTFFREYGALRAALKIIATRHEIKDAPDAKPLKVQFGKIDFQNVNFSYHEGQRLFSNLNLSIKAGEKVGLVGFTGSGKTSFINLILRCHEISAGSILIDNQNITHVTQESLREKIVMIPQEPVLFHRTIMENIRYGRLDATDEEVEKVSKLAHCHEFIEKLEAGYASIVGERGAKFSNGQRQRISIARAILKKSPILIMDEATSALDSITEKIIQENLAQLMEDKTCIIIAHRLSTLEKMDRILVFNKGEIIEDNSKDELLKLNGVFKKLWDMQIHGFIPENELV